MTGSSIDYDIAIVGGGVVGLAVAERFSREGHRVVVVERHPGLGWETSSRNSEVIHSGIYYPTGSMKAQLCTEGREMLYAFCTKHDVGHRRCGKLIVATEMDEIPELDRIQAQGEVNGVPYLYRMNAEECRRIEPHVHACEAIYVPSTGIVDSHGLMVRLSQMAESRDADIVIDTTLQAVDYYDDIYTLSVESGGEPHQFTASTVINSAGLEADRVAELGGAYRPEYELSYARGHYFRLIGTSSSIVRRLVYPVPYKQLAGLGIHTTVDLGGGVKLGPDVEWLDEKVQDYSVHPELAQTFYEVARRYLPGLRREDLVADQAGIRPKVKTRQGQVQDFIISEESELGQPGWINLIGIESPGLTSCLSIADYVMKLWNISR